jgi:hypothetical protein
MENCNTLPHVFKARRIMCLQKHHINWFVPTQFMCCGGRSRTPANFVPTFDWAWRYDVFVWHTDDTMLQEFEDDVEVSQITLAHGSHDVAVSGTVPVPNNSPCFLTTTSIQKRWCQRDTLVIIKHRKQLYRSICCGNSHSTYNAETLWRF